MTNDCRYFELQEPQKLKFLFIGRSSSRTAATNIDLVMGRGRADWAGEWRRFYPRQRVALVGTESVAVQTENGCKGHMVVLTFDKALGVRMVSGRHAPLSDASDIFAMTRHLM